ncbi:MAG: DUF4347 domain-containing protein [Microcystis sp.]|uniref:DUF4347 domain-containing protein n=1 Tax=Microcystis sp. TaxID=1127 RepID=UPI00391B5398
MSRQTNLNQSVVFLDAGVSDYQSLQAGVIPEVATVILSANQDGIEQISAFLQQNPQITTIHLVSHGAPGCLYLGNCQLNLTNIYDYRQQLQNWAKINRILLYGCQVAAGDAGGEFINKLSQITGAKIAASSRRVGNAALGGNWELEVIVSRAESEQDLNISLAFDGETLATYEGVFALSLVGRWDRLSSANAVTVVGNYAYAVGDTLEIIDISNPSDPIFKGNYDISDGQDVQIVGNYAYVADSNSGLTIIDISNPDTPTFVSNYDTTANPYDVEIVGNYAYVADAGFGGLLIIDISNPAAPTFVDIDYTSDLPYDVEIVGNYAYVADYWSGLQIFEIFNPAAPTLVGNYDTSGNAEGVEIVGNYAYVADGGGGLQIIDISNPAAPTLVGNYDTYGNAEDVEIVGNYAYVADGGLLIIDISNRTTPTFVGNYDTYGDAEDVQIVGNYAYVADGGGGLTIIDISNPAAPTLVDNYNPSGSANDVKVVGNYAYVADGFSGLQIIDISNPAAPTLVSNHTTYGNASGVQIVGNYAYVADGPSGLTIIDISNPAAPTFVSNYYNYYNPYTYGYAYDVQIVGNYAYVADYWSAGLQIIDISNPDTPTFVGNYDDTSGYALGVQIVGNYAYVANEVSGLQIIDISTPDTPTLVGNYDTYGNASGVQIVGNYAYVADGPSGLTIIDINNPAAPTFVGNYDTSGFASDVQIVGNYAYVADGSGLQIIDISNPAAPTLVDNYITSGYSALGVEVVGNYAYVADYFDGLKIIDVSGFNNPSPLPSVTLAVSTTSVTEDGTANLVYTFTRTGDTTNPLTVNFTTVDDTDWWKRAIFNTDYSQTGAASFPNYSSETGTVTFAANSATATVTIDPTADTTVEDDETVSLTLTSGTDYTVGTTTPVTGTILNDDTRVTLQVSPSLVTEDGTTNLAYFFYRDGVTTNALTVNYTVGGTATLNTDYSQTGAASFNGTTGTVTFAANANNATVTIDPTVDNIADPDETVTLTLASGTGYTVGTTTTVTGTINDDINPPTPTFISKYDTPGWAFGVEVVGNYAYLADYDSGLQIIDISNPTNPIFKGNYDTDGAWDVEVVGNYAYLADGSSGLQIINISNPTNPTFIGNYDNFSAVVDVQVVGNYAYLANGNSLLQIIDISNPTNPILKGSYDDSSGFADGVQVVGNYAYIADYFSGLQIIDISNPTNPILKGNYYSSGNARDVEVVGNYAYLADYDSGLQIIDISNPTNPILKGNYYSSGEATDVQVVGNYAYLAAGGGGLQIIDISNPTNPTIKGNYQNNYDYAFDVKVVGNYAYVAAREGGLQIIDVSDFNDVNESPTDVTLSNNTVAENSPLNTLIGDFTTTDPDTGNTFTYGLVTGTGDTDNSLFTIDGNQLKVNGLLDYETKNNYSIRVKTTDQGGLSSEKQLTVNVSDVNENPFTFQLILLEDNNNTPGNIITDNIIKGSSFFVEIQLGDIRNNALGLIAASLNINFAADVIQNNDNSFDPTDPNSLLVTPNFPLFRLGTLDNSSGLITNLSGAAFPVTGEGSAIGVNQLSTFSLLRFQVNGTRDDSQLVINLDPNQTGYSDGSVIDPNSITQIQTTLNINDAPIVDAIATTNLSEFSPANTLVTTVNATDDNKTGQAVTFSLLTVPTDNNNNPLFTINSATGEITLTAAGSSIIDYETGPTVYTLGVKASDGYKDSPETTFTVSVSDVNENPTNLNLSNNTVAENSPLNTLIGNFTTTDPDTGNTFTYSLVTGTGSTDNSLFTIDGNQLKTNTTLDYETQNNYSIRVKTADQGGLSYEKQLTINITNILEQGISVDKNAITFGTPLSQYRQGWSNSNLVRPKFADTFRYIDITNTGVNDEDILAISNIEVKASNVTTNADFSQGDILLNPGQTWRVQLTYAPTAARESFNLNDGLVIHSNAINNTAYNVALTGKSTFNSDITYNGKVDRGDLAPLQAAFNSSIGGSKYDPTADINGDGGINLGDFLVLTSDYGLSLI